MATANEIGRMLDQKRGELQEFVKTRTTSEGLNFEGEEIKAFNDRGGELKTLQEQFDGLQRAENLAKSNSDSIESGLTVHRSGVYGGAANGAYGAQGGSIKTLGDLFLESSEYKSQTREKFAVEMANSSLKAVLTGSVLPYPTQQPGAIPFAVRTPVVADLIPQTDTDQPSIVYLEQTLQSFGAAPVAEGALKPESDFAWTRRTAAFEVIAHWAKISLQSLEDAPAIRDIINQDLVRGLQLAEESQLLVGNGTSPQIQGFLTKTGVQTQAKGGVSVFEAFMSTLTKIRFTGFSNPTGAVFHPTNWQGVVTAQDTTGRFIFGDPAVLQQSMQLWGIPVRVTPAITLGTALVGDFQGYSRLWRRGGIRTVVDMTGDDLIRNLRTILAEERLALQISRAAAFCTLTGL